MKFARLHFVARRDFLVRPGTVSDGSFEQSAIFELVGEDRFEEIEIRNRFGMFQSVGNYNKTPEAVEKNNDASGA